MPQIPVYQCPFTGAIFYGKPMYVKHLREHRKGLRALREEKRVLVQWGEELAQASKEVGNLNELAEWFIMHHWALYSIACDSFGRKITRNTADPIIVKLKFENFDFSERTRNTHSCPKGGETNWSCEVDRPRGYPGVRGKLKIWSIKGDHGYWVSDALKAASICTGIGGGGGIVENNPSVVRFEYDATIWLDDWKALGENFSFAKLSGTTLLPLNGEYCIPEYFPKEIKK